MEINNFVNIVANIGFPVAVTSYSKSENNASFS